MLEEVKKNPLVLNTINTAGLVCLLAYTVKTFNETNLSIENLRMELEGVKKMLNDNTQRANVVFGKINEKIENTISRYENVTPPVQEKVQNNNVSLGETSDDIDSAVKALLSN